MSQVLPGRGVAARRRRLRLPARKRGAVPGIGNSLSRQHSAGEARRDPPVDGARLSIDRLFRCARFTASRCRRSRSRAAQERAARPDAHRRLRGRSAPIANQAGIAEVEAGLDPAGKLARIRALQQEGLRVAMVGDGINDAAALAQADAGIAMGSGADLAQEAGDVLLLRAQPSAILAAHRSGPATVAHHAAEPDLGRRLQPARYSACRRTCSIPPFHILLSPWIAAAAMALSSVSVLANSLRLRRWQPHSLPAAQAS